MQNKVITAFVIILTSARLLAAAPVQWSGNGHYYDAISFPQDVSNSEVALAIAAVGPPYAVIGPDGIGWWEARSIAASRGGYLASIQSQAENDFVFSLVNDSRYWKDGKGPWLGGMQDLASPAYQEPGGAWVWIDDFNPAHFEPLSYTNWYSGEPNNSGGYENVTHFCTEGLSLAPSPFWNDLASNNPTVGFVIEYVVPEPFSVVLAAIGFIGLAPLGGRQRN